MAVAPRAAARRTTELGLVVLASIVVAGAYVLASLGKSASLPANIVPFLVFVLGLLVAAHVATRRLAPAADPILLPLAGLLNGIGYVFIARLDPDLAANQSTWTALGIAAFIATLFTVRQARDLERYRYTFALAGIALLLMPLLPGIGHTVNGSRIWIAVGPMSFQPGELAKIALALFFAGYLVEKREVLAMARRVGPVMIPELGLRYIGPLLAAWGFSLVVMVFQTDLGSSLLFFALFVVMLWVATGRGFYLASGGVLFFMGAFVAWTMFDHVQQRVEIWIDPWADAGNRGYQLVQALFAFGTGGTTGTGLALGSPGKIPAATTDFIFAAIGEELGLLGTTAVVSAFLLIAGAGVRIALRAPSDFEKLLALGLTSIIGIQSFIILGGVTRLVPLTGITLPFVSYGGSSLIANYILLALLMRVSDGGLVARPSPSGRAAARPDPDPTVGVVAR